MNVLPHSFLLSLLVVSTTQILHANINVDAYYKNNPLTKQVLYAPNRHACYNAKLEKTELRSSQDCVFCSQAQNAHDENNFLITQFKHHNLFINSYPYQKGHLLLLPKNHVPTLGDLSDEEQAELIKIVSILPGILKKLFDAAGTNIGINLGKIAGASKPDHLHVHIVPRYTTEHLSFIRMTAESLAIDYNITDVRNTLRDYFAARQNQDVSSYD